MDEIDRLKQFINRRKLTVDVLGELNRLLEGDYNAEIIEAILGELVEIASVGQEECAVQAQLLLADKYRCVAEKRKSDIINGVLTCTEKNLNDPAVFFLAFNFALKLKWKELFKAYIDLYDEQLRLEFGDDYIQWLELSEYLTDS